MKNLRKIIPNNIIYLRKKKGLTQIDLAKKVNFSDKAVSRWEKGEVLPDVETLQQIAKVLDVPLEYMFDEHDFSGEVVVNKPTTNDILFQALMVCVIWVIITVAFVYVQMIYKYVWWQVFLWGIPVTASTCFYLNRKWNSKILNIIWSSILNWSLLTCIYLQFMSLNLWAIFLIGLPLQGAIVVASLAKHRTKDF